jgi:endonuclease-8
VPEGDTVHAAARRLRTALEGKELTKSDLRVPALANADLACQRLDEVVARGKHLLFRFSGGLTLHTHFKMEGAWHLYRPGQRWRGPAFQARAILETADRIAVGFRLGQVDLVSTSEEDTLVGHLGPDVLGPDWDPQEVLSRMRSRGDRGIGEVLLDQRVLAGPGNVYKSEICFLRGIHPSTPVDRVPDLEGLIRLTKRLMEANRESGNQVTTGETRPGRRHWVYGRAGQPCRRCRTPIRRAEHPGYGGDRVTSWCPTCQPESTAGGGFLGPADG